MKKNIQRITGSNSYRFNNGARCKNYPRDTYVKILPQVKKKKKDLKNCYFQGLLTFIIHNPFDLNKIQNKSIFT